MADIDTDEEKYETVQGEDEQFWREHVRDPRAFFVLSGAVLAIILFSIFLNLRLDGFTQILVLLSTLALFMIGGYLVEKRIASTYTATLSSDRPEPPGEEKTGTDEQETDPAHEQRELEPADSFEILVQEALDAIPVEFHEQMKNLVVIVENEPDEEALRQAGTGEGQTLLGLYQGVPMTQQGHYYALLPERITIYQQNIERLCNGDPARIRAQVHATVLHEVAHHFGMGHEEMPIWVK